MRKGDSECSSGDVPGGYWEKRWRVDESGIWVVDKRSERCEFAFWREWEIFQ